jgi:hypothetical protein
MELSPSREDNKCLPFQEVPSILWNQRSIALFTKSPLCPYPEPDESNIRTLTFHFLTTHLILYFHLHPSPSDSHLSSCFPIKTMYVRLFEVCYMPWQSSSLI